MENHFNCIYCYTNKVNGKKYVGQAVDFERRHKQHIHQAYNEKHKAYNYYFHSVIRKYGIENFEIKILIENLSNQEELNYWEKFYIAEFDTLAKNQKGYNLASGGEGGNTLVGKTDEELAEFGRKISKANKGKFTGKSNPMYGKNPLTGKTEEELLEIYRKKSKTWNNKTEEELIERNKKWHEAMNNKSEEEKAEKTRKWRESMNNRSDKEKEETYRKLSEAGKGLLIDRFTLDGQYIDTCYNFEYKQMGFSGSGISHCCRGRIKSTGGYVFKYHNK